MEFVPLNETLKNRLQTLAVGIVFLHFFIGPFILIYFLYLLFTPFWWIPLLYLSWMYMDRHTCGKGGRTLNWIQNQTWFRYVNDYFPARLRLVPGFTLDPHKNYLFCSYPHGVVPIGAFSSILSKAGDFFKTYPNFQVRYATTKWLHCLPVNREIYSAMGIISCSFNSLEYVLTKPEGGYITILNPGGAAEAEFAKPGNYIFVVKKRKGFVKLALKTGAPLIPVITFGEIDLFCQIELPGFKKFQEFMKKCFGVVPILFTGRGFLQYTFGLLPRKKPLTTIVGMPIGVRKSENPTVVEIDTLHKKFMEELVDLFETYKHEYLGNSEKVSLELV